ncbi:MAG: histidine--tRNA ligase [Steroidobacteraceae bacterium]
MTSRVLQPVRGMNDQLPADLPLWHRLEGEVRALLHSYGYDEIRVPIVEQTQLFSRAIGEYTDVVEKEMYSFTDQGGEQLTLRPEATAGVVRAVISNGMLRGARLKLWCAGPMFRHERPQKGRYRQFHQVSVEAIGFAGPDVDAELILLGTALWRRLGIAPVSLSINSLGTASARAAYRAVLQDYFRGYYAELDDDSRRRLDGNPLRILDSKNPDLQKIIAAAPSLSDHLDGESAEHFGTLQGLLGDAGVAFTVNPRLVRGLDYYSRTVFEWTTTALGAQDAICSGGRYDGLIQVLGGEPTPAIGFAMGLERIVSLMQHCGAAAPVPAPDVYVIAEGDRALSRAMRLAEHLRTERPGWQVQVNLGGGNFKAQFRRAAKMGARVALILGDRELERDVVGLKVLAGGQQGEQLELRPAELPGAIDAHL